MTNGTPIDFTKPLPPMASPTTTKILDGPAIGAPLPPVAYLVRELALVAGGGPPHLVAGYGYSGKTLAMQALALALASGRSVWGAYTTGAPRRVLHVDFEQGEYLTRQRYQRLARAMGVELATLEDRLALISLPRGVALKREFEAWWFEHISGRQLVIVDSLRAATGGMDENSSTIRDPLDMLTELSERTECRALVIHHARKPSENAAAGDRYSIRGSGAIFDATDSVYVLSAADKHAPIKVAHERAKSDGRTIEDFALEISDVPYAGDPRGALTLKVFGKERLEEHAAVAASRRAEVDAESIRRELRKRPGLATMQLRERARLSGSRWRDAIALLEASEEVECRNEPRGNTRPSECWYLRSNPDDGGLSGSNPTSAEAVR